MFRSKPLMLAASLMAAPVLAETTGDDSFNGCDIAPGEFQEIVAPLLSAGWKVTNGPGKVDMGGMVMPLAALPGTEAMLIAYNEQSGELYVDGESFGTLAMYPLDLSGVSEEERLIGVVEEIDGTMFDESVDCNPIDMPVVAFDGYRMEQGTQASFHVRYFVVNPDLMVGNMRMTLAGMSEGQPVEMQGFRYLVARANR